VILSEGRGGKYEQEGAWSKKTHILQMVDFTQEKWMCLQMGKIFLNETFPP
jgi:hypothetical protein